MDPAGSGTKEGVDAPKSRSPAGRSHACHSGATKMLFSSRVKAAMPVTPTTSCESDVARGSLDVSPVTP